MIVRLFLCFAMALTMISLHTSAQAQPQTQAGGRRAHVLSLIVTNNKSATLGRPELRYADDDGAKYYEVFRMLAPETNLALLTQFDRDTRGLFPPLAAKVKAPTRAEVLSAAQSLAARARELSATGDVHFYFVFAGHGDVDRGQGFIELLDGAFTARDLEDLLKNIPAVRAHVIVDSCNSFFMIQPRKPGGRRFATPEDAARGLKERLPNVGVFLSTSADGEVFEWSELQSGIFSHAVRSGLMGGADANGDGVVSYGELRAFVDTASTEVKNPRYRPHVFARGPSGQVNDPLVSLKNSSASVLRIDPGAGVRLTLRDSSDLPWMDIHAEKGFGLSLRLPASLQKNAIVEESEVRGEATRVLRRSALVPSDDSSSTSRTTLANLTPLAGAPEPRGQQDLFRMLFARPFGPLELAQYEEREKSSPPDVYGVSEEDKERMRLMLENVAGQEHDQRIVTGVVCGIGGLGLMGIGTYALATLPSRGGEDRDSQRLAGYIGLGSGGAFAIYSAASLLGKSKGEEIYDEYKMRLARENADQVIADTERRLLEITEKYETMRITFRWVGVGVAAVGATTLVANELFVRPNLEGKDRQLGAFLLGASAGLIIDGGALIGASFIRSPIERTVDQWRNDPSRLRWDVPRPSLTVSPSITALPNGGAFGLQGTF